MIRNHFPDGVKVGAYIAGNVTDFSPGLEAEKTVTVKDGAAKFSGLTDNGHYFAAAEVPVGEDGKEWRAVRFTAKPKEFENLSLDLRKRAFTAERERLAQIEARSKQHKEAEKADPLAHSPAPGRTMPINNPLVGARTTAEALSRQTQPPTVTAQEAAAGVTVDAVPDPEAGAEESVPRLLKDRTVAQLREQAVAEGVKGASRMKKAELVKALQA